MWGCPAYVEALFSNLELRADGLEAGPTPAAAIPIDGAVISDSENDSSAASGSSESEGGVGRGNGRGHENGVGNINTYDNNDDGSLPSPVNVPEGAEEREN